MQWSVFSSCKTHAGRAKALRWSFLFGRATGWPKGVPSRRQAEQILASLLAAAQAALLWLLRGETRGYRNHPQLDRFRKHAAPLAAISVYLKGVHADAKARGYAFDKSTIKPARKSTALTVTFGQMAYEWTHLLGKLKVRNPALYEKWRTVAAIANTACWLALAALIAVTVGTLAGAFRRQ